MYLLLLPTRNLLHKHKISPPKPYREIKNTGIRKQEEHHAKDPIFFYL